ncbi:glycoside hydrolase family 2 TIM barrel-domain containing protein [Microbacterium insulae]|uniref:Glycoside hydrolase family 2 TIM barrel-domain containing protein n=1 Tax=Microbacterium insulae TaxID=483014 RepID=A0ABW3AI54_9MICO
MNNHVLHPRPQLIREDWESLNGQWEFAIDDADIGSREHWHREPVVFPMSIEVPFPPESPASGIGVARVERVWYRRVIDRRPPEDGRRVILHFTAVDYIADVWVNSVHVAHHVGGSVGFSADITDALAPGDAQTIVVRAFDSSTSLEQPRGKQDWEEPSHVIWYRRTTGIWREVWWEVAPPARIQKVAWQPVTASGRLRADVSVTGAEPGDSVEITLTHEGDVLARTTLSVADGYAKGVIELRDSRLEAEPERLQWSPESPTLIDARIRLVRGGGVLDHAESYVGLRTVGVDNRRFLLNGRPYPLRLVLEQAYWPDTHLAAPDADALRREVELVRELGFNGVRMHQVVADPRFLYWCDRLGLVVWADSPASYEFTALSFTRTVQEWQGIVERDVSHPCVIAWVPFNESWGVPDLGSDRTQQEAVRALVHMLRALDPSRLVLGNDGWQYVAGDIVGIHDYSASARELIARYGSAELMERAVADGYVGGRRVALDPGAADVPVVLSEFGGVSYSRAADTWEGYGVVPDEEAFVDTVAAHFAAAHDSAFAGFCYTQLTDTLQERNGLLNEAREPKAPIDLLRSIVLDDRQRIQRLRRGIVTAHG